MKVSVSLLLLLLLVLVNIVLLAYAVAVEGGMYVCVSVCLSSCKPENAEANKQRMLYAASQINYMVDPQDLNVGYIEKKRTTSTK